MYLPDIGLFYGYIEEQTQVLHNLYLRLFFLIALCAAFSNMFTIEH
jgi:TRAP-type mannitol/chloroaromatic compound transport system permease small subunit